MAGLETRLRIRIPPAHTDFFPAIAGPVKLDNRVAEES
jgi:hypothetical protein